jgi:hypothetical protein
MDGCSKKLEKFNVEALQPIIIFRRDKTTGGAAIRAFNSLLSATIGGAKTVGLLKMLINK